MRIAFTLTEKHTKGDVLAYRVKGMEGKESEVGLWSQGERTWLDVVRRRRVMRAYFMQANT